MNDDEFFLPTHLGHAGWNDHEVRGVVVFDLDLDPDTTPYFDLALLTLGIPRSPHAGRVLALCTQAALNPDPRIPPMKLIRLGAAYGDPLIGLGTGLVGMAGAAVGMSAIARAARFLAELHDELGEAASPDALAEALARRLPRIEGFGVPGRPTDERFSWIAPRLRKLGGPRPHGELLDAMAAPLERKHRRPNLGGAIAAALLDIGCPVSSVASAACVIGLLPLLGNAHEGADQAPPLLQALPSERSVSYEGPPPRKSPRATKR